MLRGGRSTGAGRKPDSLNKRTIEAVKTMGSIGERAIGVLVSVMEDPSAPWSCRIQAASLVADRAFGRAPQSVSLGVTRRRNDLTLDELRQLEVRLAGEQLTIDAVATPAAETASDHRQLTLLEFSYRARFYPRIYPRPRMKSELAIASSADAQR